MKELIQRKHLLVLQADMHRQMLTLERQHLRQGVGEARDRLQTGRWWLIGGGLLVGWLFTRKLPGFTRWLPLAMPAWRLARGFLLR